MTSQGTFAYPLVFSAMLAAFGLMVDVVSKPPTPTAKPTETTAQKHSKAPPTKYPLNQRIAAELIARCDEFLIKYPGAEHTEDVMSLAGEVRVERALGDDWKEAGRLYRNLECMFPNSENIDRYVFFQGMAFFYDASFAESSPIFARFLKDYPNSKLAERALYFVAMSHLLGYKYKESLTSISDYLKKYPDGDFAADLTYRLSLIDFNEK